MSKARLVEIERFYLSDGSIRITKLGRTYNYNRLWCDINSKPVCTIGISKAEAYALAEAEVKHKECEPCQ